MSNCVYRVVPIWTVPNFLSLANMRAAQNSTHSLENYNELNDTMCKPNSSRAHLWLLLFCWMEYWETESVSSQSNGFKNICEFSPKTKLFELENAFCINMNLLQREVVSNILVELSNIGEIDCKTHYIWQLITSKH